MSPICCPGCGHADEYDDALRESAFTWCCAVCGRSYEVRIVFLPREKEVNEKRFRREVLELLHSQRLTRSDLARLVGVTPAYISTILSGRRRVSSEIAARVIHALRIRVSE